jgi:hypothetical protein
VLGVVGKQIAQREAIVAGDEIHGRRGLATGLPVKIGRSEDALHHFTHEAGFADLAVFKTAALVHYASPPNTQVMSIERQSCHLLFI